MSEIIYQEDWTSSNIQCNWKPQKLSRYSFVSNLIDYDDADVEIGKMQGMYPPNLTYQTINNPDFNLTGYIPVSIGLYKFICEQGLDFGVRSVFFFDSSKNVLRWNYYDQTSASSLEGTINTNVDPSITYIRIQLYKNAWNKCFLKEGSSSYSSLDKDMTPLDIVDNKAGAKIYEDLHFEVYVKAEAEIKNLVDCFDLDIFQRYPLEGNLFIRKSCLFSVSTKNYYWDFYNDFIPNHVYSEGEWVKGAYITTDDKIHYYYLICVISHTSASDFNIEYDNNHNKWGTLMMIIRDSYSWLNIDKQIKESNYQQDFPYVGSLVFKNLWGCNLIDDLKTFVKESYLTIVYDSFFAENLRKTSSQYTKFFNQGYFKNVVGNQTIEGYGIRFLIGEYWKNDEYLGNNLLNNYFIFEEKGHSIPLNWNSYLDPIINNNFRKSPVTDSFNHVYLEGGIVDPFDHYYKFSPKINIPFFKERVFVDNKIELTIQRQDILGNIYKRIIDLPISVTFTNNLIKCYYKKNTATVGLSGYYFVEFLNSEIIYDFTLSASSGSLLIYVWCPDVKKLSLSSTVTPVQYLVNLPALYNPFNNVTQTINPLDGQIAVLMWTVSNMSVGSSVIGTFNFEYSDGENYDKFTFIQRVTRNE